MQKSLTKFDSRQIKTYMNDDARYFRALIQLLQFYKTKKCSKEGQHDEQSCELYHSLKDRRRNPFITHKFQYYPWVLCACDPSLQINTAQKCSNYHNQYEKMYHPLLYKTQKCINYYQCENGLYCSQLHQDDEAHFAHGVFFRFDITTFKTEPCNQKDSHERKICRYFHNDQDRRRHNFNYYNHMPCSKRNCDWKNCEYSHNKIEQLYHPSRYKSKFCQTYPNKLSHCNYREFCSFAHSQAEITIEIINTNIKDPNYIINTYKTIWCPFTQNHDRSNCPYAHNIQDYRRKPKQYKYQPERCQFWNFSEQIKSIEEAGCKAEWKCNKCHGWMEYRYHPLVYKKNQTNQKVYVKIKQKHIERKLIKVAEIKKANSKQKKMEGIVSNQIDTGKAATNANYSVGAPFFKKERQASQASKQTKARTAKVGSNCSNKSGDDSEHKEKKELEIENMKKISSMVFEEEDHLVWGKHFPLIQNRESSRSKSQGNSDQYQPNYSKSIQDALNDSGIIKKLLQKKVNEVSLINMNQHKVNNMKFLEHVERQKLIKKLKEYALRRDIKPIEYSKQLTLHFINRKCTHILEKLKQKKVKQEKIVSLNSKEIKDLSFLDNQEKELLLKLLKKFKEHKQYYSLIKSVDKYVEDTALGQ